MPTTPSNRLTHLRAYFLALGADMAAAGKFHAAGNDKIEAAAFAVLGGTGAMAAQLWEDVRALGGEGAALARPMVEGLIANAADRAVRAGVDRAASAVVDLLTGSAKKREAQKNTGAEIMRAARRLGQRDSR